MKKYFKLENDISWEDIILNYQPEIFALLDSNNDNYIFAWEPKDTLIQKKYKEGRLNKLQQINKGEFLFGYLSYNIKNKSKNDDLLNFPESIFFIPKYLLIKKNNNLIFYGDTNTFSHLKKIKPFDIKFSIANVLDLKSDITYNEYNRKIKSILKELKYGNIYEVNYCMQFYKEKINIDVLQTFLKLKSNTKAPFSSLFKFNNYTIISGSPERFFQKHNTNIISQPIKGTAPRSPYLKEDNIIKNELLANKKENSENIMIVDLVRNDLSKISLKNSVVVKELCKLYSFKTVHQLISTVKSQVNTNISTEEIIEAIFPMGSMTGAPKLNAINLIEIMEDFNRSVYSGSIGFISPTNNQDFNVVIRSILYNSDKKTLSIPVGGAITIKSTSQAEYNECLLKLKSIKNSIVLNQ